MVFLLRITKFGIFSGLGLRVTLKPCWLAIVVGCAEVVLIDGSEVDGVY